MEARVKSSWHESCPVFKTAGLRSYNCEADVFNANSSGESLCGIRVYSLRCGVLCLLNGNLGFFSLQCI